jgi:hypothetical protein
MEKQAKIIISSMYIAKLLLLIFSKRTVITNRYLKYQKHKDLLNK